MADLKQRIEAEIEYIELVLQEIPPHYRLPELSILELAGVATLLHNFYNGIENILKQILLSKNISIPVSASWHKDLIDLANTHKIITNKLKQSLGEYLAFRHFFSHAYALDLYPQRMEPLVKNIKSVYKLFKNALGKYISNNNTSFIT